MNIELLIEREEDRDNDAQSLCPTGVLAKLSRPPIVGGMMDSLAKLNQNISKLLKERKLSRRDRDDVSVRLARNFK